MVLSESRQYVDLLDFTLLRLRREQIEGTQTEETILSKERGEE